MCLTAARGFGASTSSRSPTSTCRRCAARASASPSGTQGLKHGAARPGEEAGLEQQRHDLGLADGVAVEALDREPLRAAAPHVVDERGERRTQPGLVRLAQRHERAPAALDEQRCLSAEQDDVRARDARRARARALRPRNRGSVRLRRIGRGEHERLRLVALARAQLAQALDRAGQRELRAAEPFDEVAAAADAERLEVAQLAVDGAVAAGDPLAAHAVARDDALALEQQLGQRTPVGPVPGTVPGTGPKRRAVSDQRPCVDVTFALRWREKRRGRARWRCCVA